MAVHHPELWERWLGLRETAARDELVEIYLWLVRYVAGRLMVGLPPHYDQNDVEGHGMFGLLDAVDRYDPSRGVRFETYAIPWIRGACLAGLRTMQWAPALRKRVRQMEKAVVALQQELGRDPSDAELAQWMRISVAELEQRIAEAGCLTVVSMEESLADEDGQGSSLGDRLADPTVPDPVELRYQEERRELLAQAIDSLPDRERIVVSLFYYEGLMAREISDLLNLSQARISQIHSQAILRLRGKLSRMKALLVS